MTDKEKEILNKLANSWCKMIQLDIFDLDVLENFFEKTWMEKSIFDFMIMELFSCVTISLPSFAGRLHKNKVAHLQAIAFRAAKAFEKAIVELSSNKINSSMFEWEVLPDATDYLTGYSVRDIDFNSEGEAVYSGSFPCLRVISCNFHGHDLINIDAKYYLRESHLDKIDMLKGLANG